MMHIEGQPSWFNITYQTQANASTFGPVVATEVKLGSLSVPNFGVGVATQLAFNYPLDGFMGLGFKGLNTGTRLIPQILMHGNKILQLANGCECSSASTTADSYGGCPAASPTTTLHGWLEAQQPGHAELWLYRQLAVSG